MYDVIVVGARCAGASLAIFLGQKGYRVLLLDKFSAPGPTLSTHIIGETEVYEQLQVRKSMESAGAPPMTRFRVDLAGHVFESDIITTPRAISLRRELLDRILLDEAVRLPTVEVALNCRVVSVLSSQNKVTGVHCQQADGTFRSIFGRVVIGADGRNSRIAEEVEAETTFYTEQNHHSVYFAYLSGMIPLPTPTVEWYWHGDSVLICNPLDRSLHCVAIMLPQDSTLFAGKEMSEAFLRYLSSVKTLHPRLKDAQVQDRVRGIRRLASFMRKPYGNGWALVGDASAHLHPITGAGIDNAVCCSQYLAGQIEQYFTQKKSWPEAMSDYQKLRDQRIVPQLEASLQTLAKTKQQPSAERLQSLGMLCTFPSLVKQLANQIDSVLSLCREEKSCEIAKE
ncbi:NAD(P)/FAD-dependent oxidoreductase [Brevibacillus fulvus]|uniref:Flavin-dependent dehydrogenase n=1 Tax=Brevibacillus fulvus TaxID=1125967 RepID=A0A938Y1X7_9BACL|nr:NAD(P)/FAD-dependent oxidoreductase [Brevibacillus fulvus]MBM7589675.1 flavin-dependent dehydrogenase [Brevibacillus fulvus]